MSASLDEMYSIRYTTKLLLKGVIFWVDLQKNIVLYLLIIAAFVIAIDAFSGQSANKSELSYTGFIQQVQQKRLSPVTITNDHGIKGKPKMEQSSILMPK